MKLYNYFRSSASFRVRIALALKQLPYEYVSIHLARGEHQLELDERINAWTATLTIDEVDALMIRHSIPAGRVYTAADMMDDPHFQAREAIVEVETRQRGKLKMQGTFPKLSRTPSSIRRAAPATPGQDNGEVYGELFGWDFDKLADLAGKGII